MPIPALGAASRWPSGSRIDGLRGFGMAPVPIEGRAPHGTASTRDAPPATARVVGGSPWEHPSRLRQVQRIASGNARVETGFGRWVRSYERMHRNGWARLGSNQRPRDYENQAFLRSLFKSISCNTRQVPREATSSLKTIATSQTKLRNGYARCPRVEPRFSNRTNDGRR